MMIIFPVHPVCVCVCVCRYIEEESVLAAGAIWPTGTVSMDVGNVRYPLHLYISISQSTLIWYWVDGGSRLHRLLLYRLPILYWYTHTHTHTHIHTHREREKDGRAFAFGTGVCCWCGASKRLKTTSPARGNAISPPDLGNRITGATQLLSSSLIVDQQPSYPRDNIS